MKRAVISIGTNSTRALVAELNGKVDVLLRRSTGTRIGEGLKETGRLAAEPMQRTLDAVRDHMSAVCALTDDICAIATSALRRAENSVEFEEALKRLLPSRLEIISGQEEARRSFIGAVCGLPASQDTIGVVDTGGGSTEFARGTSDGPQQVISCEIGAVRLTEAVPELDGTHGAVNSDQLARARAIVRDATAPIERGARPMRLVLVGGTATTAVSIERGTRDVFDYATLTRTRLGALIERLCSSDLETRKGIAGMNPQRADILLGGALILDEVFERTEHREATVSTNDLLLGTLLCTPLAGGASAARGETITHD